MIRNAQLKDLEKILEIYAHARSFMAANGNPDQWKDGYPYEDVLREDIEAGQLYVIEENEICAVFAFIPGTDPTYGYIEGAWHYDVPYAAIHRVASSGKVRGVMEKIVAFCAQRSGCLRIDTHKDNHIMQRAVEKQGFQYCGIIYLENGSPRLAYDKTVSC